MQAIVQATREELDTDEVSFIIISVESGTLRAKLMWAIVQATREELDTNEVSYSREWHSEGQVEIDMGNSTGYMGIIWHL